MIDYGITTWRWCSLPFHYQGIDILILIGDIVTMSEHLSRTVPFTAREQQILDALVECKSYKGAAEKLGTTEGNLRNTTLKIRLRYENAKSFVAACEQVQKYLPRKKRYVTG